MVNWRFLEQIRRSLRLHCFAGRRIGEHLLGDHEHARASRYYLCAIGVSYYVWHVGKFEGGEGRESWGAGTFAVCDYHFLVDWRCWLILFFNRVGRANVSLLHQSSNWLKPTARLSTRLCQKSVSLD